MKKKIALVCALLLGASGCQTVACGDGTVLMKTADYVGQPASPDYMLPDGSGGFAWRDGVGGWNDPDWVCVCQTP